MFTRKFGFTLASGAACLVIVCVMMIAQPPVIRRVDKIIYDSFLKGFLGGTPSEIPILIDIDEKSIAELGQWPWPRYRLAELLISLYENGIAAIGVDILMPEPDRTSPELWVKQISDDFGIRPDISGIPDELMNNDEYLASIMSQIPVVLSAFGVGEQVVGREGGYRPLNVTPYIAPNAGLQFSAISGFLPKFGGIQLPVPELAGAATYVGLMNAEGDEDSIFRRVQLFSVCGEDLVSGLALATLALGMGDSSVVVRMGPDGPYSVRVAGIETPVSSGGTMPVAFRGGRGSYHIYSAVDVLNGDVPPESFAGRIAFIGSTSVGLLDLRSTPFDATFPGLELHAAAVDTILSQRFIIEPQMRIGFEVIVTFITGLVAAVLFSTVRPHIALPIGIALAAAVWFAFRYEMVAGGVYITPLYSLVNMAMQAFSAFALRFWLEEREKRVLRRAFSNYVSPEIVGKIVESGSVNSLQGEQRNISVLFTDLRGFTSMTEKMAPTQVVAMLGSYFTPMTSIVRNSMGTLDKFVGDALMAFWNAPLNVPDHPVKAVLSLMEMHRALAKLNLDLESEFGFTLRMGGGIHTGPAHVGNMGTSELMDYTAIGDTVNTASRLEGMCPKYGVGSVISGDTAERCAGLGDGFVIKPLDLVRVKGRTSGIPIFTVLTPEEAGERKDELSLWGEAFDLYKSGDFLGAWKICGSLIRTNPDEKLYRIFAERTESMKTTPENWDGVFIYDSK